MNIHEGKVLVIINPAAKRFEAARAGYHVRHLLREDLGAVKVDVIQTTSPGHATFLASTTAGEYASVVVVGGDGVVHETINGLMSIEQSLRPVLGVVPVGSGNDYARTLGMSEDIQQACAQLLGAQARPLDVGKVNDRYFVETLSFGLDAAIAIGTIEARNHTEKTGGALYFEVGIDQLLHHLNNYHVQMVFDDERSVDTSVIMCTVQNGPTYGGGFNICPDAQPDDGFFDICYAEGKWSIPRTIYSFARARKGKHTRDRGVKFERASKIHIRFEDDPPAQAEGEIVTGSEFTISMCHKALQVFVP